MQHILSSYVAKANWELLSVWSRECVYHQIEKDLVDQNSFWVKRRAVTSPLFVYVCAAKLHCECEIERPLYHRCLIELPTAQSQCHVRIWIDNFTKTSKTVLVIVRQGFVAKTHSLRVVRWFWKWQQALWDYRTMKGEVLFSNPLSEIHRSRPNMSNTTRELKRSLI